MESETLWIVPIRNRQLSLYPQLSPPLRISGPTFDLFQGNLEEVLDRPFLPSHLHRILAAEHTVPLSTSSHCLKKQRVTLPLFLFLSNVCDVLRQGKLTTTVVTPIPLHYPTRLISLWPRAPFEASAFYAFLQSRKPVRILVFRLRIPRLLSQTPHRTSIAPQ